MVWFLWLLLILYLFYVYFTWNYDYWYKRGVPCLPGTAPFGNISDIFFRRKIIGQLYKDIYEKFDGSPWCGFFKIRTPILMVRDPELVKQVLIREFNNFEDNDFHINVETDPILMMNPFSVSGQRWKDMRTVLTPAQSPGKIKTIIPCTIRVSKNMINYVDNNLGQSIDLLNFFGHFTTDLTAAWGLGMDINSFENPNDALRVSATNMFGGDFKSNMAILLAFYAPAIGNILKLSTMTDQFVNYFSTLVVNVLNERKRSGVKKNDLIDMLYDMSKEYELKNKRVIDFDEITGHTLTFFSEGYLTSSFTLTYVFHELSKNQSIQQRAREEIRSVVGSLDDIDFDQIQSLTYLGQIIDEGLRLYPVVPNMTRVCTKKTVFHSGIKELTVEPGTPIAIPVMGLHHDPKYYENPTVFDPDRFTEEKKLSRDRILHLGFSDGPRVCVGQRMAITNLKICLAALLLNYKILPTEQSHKFSIDSSSSFVMMPKNAYVKFEKL